MSRHRPPGNVRRERAREPDRSWPRRTRSRAHGSQNGWEFAIEVHRAWPPVGVHHFYTVAETGYYDGNRIYRVTQAYAQFGINGDPGINNLWSMTQIPADPVKQSNVKVTVAFAQNGPGRRTTQLFFNLRDNKDLDKAFVPIGKVTSGM